MNRTNTDVFFFFQTVDKNRATHLFWWFRQSRDEPSPIQKIRQLRSICKNRTGIALCSERFLLFRPLGFGLLKSLVFSSSSSRVDSLVLHTNRKKIRSVFLQPRDKLHTYRKLASHWTNRTTIISGPTTIRMIFGYIRLCGVCCSQVLLLLSDWKIGTKIAFFSLSNF